MARPIASRDLSDSVVYTFLHSRTKRLHIGGIYQAVRNSLDGALRVKERITDFVQRTLHPSRDYAVEETSFAPVALMMYGIAFISVLLASLWFSLFLAV